MVSQGSVPPSSWMDLLPFHPIAGPGDQDGGWVSSCYASSSVSEQVCRRLRGRTGKLVLLRMHLEQVYAVLFNRPFKGNSIKNNKNVDFHIFHIG